LPDDGSLTPVLQTATAKHEKPLNYEVFHDIALLSFRSHVRCDNEIFFMRQRTLGIFPMSC
jgi:hypothetical protein